MISENKGTQGHTDMGSSYRQVTPPQPHHHFSQINFYTALWSLALQRLISVLAARTPHRRCPRPSPSSEGAEGSGLVTGIPPGHSASPSSSPAPLPAPQFPRWGSDRRSAAARPPGPRSRLLRLSRPPCGSPHLHGCPGRLLPALSATGPRRGRPLPAPPWRLPEA